MRVSIFGPPYGAHNIGDEAILEGIARFLKEEERLEISAAVQEPYTCRRLGIRDIPFYWCNRPRLGMWWRPVKNPVAGLKNRKLIIQQVKDSDVIIVGGATILSDCPWHALRYVFLARAMRKPVAIFGAGMCPIEDDDTKNFVVKGVSLADAVWVRDEKVRERLVSYGVPQHHVKVGGDPAFSIDKSSCDEVLAAFGPDIEKFLTDRPVIAVCFSGESDVYHKYPVEKLVESIELMIGMGYKVLYLPTNTRPGMDIEIGRKVMESLSAAHKPHFRLIQTELTPGQVVALGSKVAAVFTSRLHLLILLSLSGVPGLALSRNEKLLDFASIFSLPALSSVTDIEPSNVVNIINQLATDRTLRERVVRLAEKRRVLALAAGKELKQWILSALINKKKRSRGSGV